MKLPRDIQGRWILAWRLLAAGTFGIVGLSVAMDTPAGWQSAPRFWGLFSFLVVWYVCVTAAGRERIMAVQPWSVGLYVLGVVAWALMLPLHHSAYALAAVMFPTTYSHLSIRYAIPIGLSLSGAMFFGGGGWKSRVGPEEVLGGVLVVATSIMLALFIHAIIGQSVEQKRLIEALESAQADLATSERQAGTLAERARLAQQIHDSVAQGFVGIVTHLEAAELTLEGRESQAAAHIDQAKASAREGLTEARRLVWDLRPDLRDGAPLSAVLTRHVSGWSTKAGVEAATVVTGTARTVGPRQETALLQAATEALNNVRAHAGASRVTVTLSYMEHEIALDVSDDGRGFPAEPPVPPPVDRGGYGLRALRERISGLGGVLSLESAPGQGTTLTVSLPVEPAP